MESKKSSKPSKQEREWQKKVEEKIKAEELKIDHPHGKEQFDQVIRNAKKKTP